MLNFSTLYLEQVCIQLFQNKKLLAYIVHLSVDLSLFFYFYLCFGHLFSYQNNLDLTLAVAELR